MSTNWSFISAASAVAHVTTATVACTPKPNVGDLMVMSWVSVRSTAFTSAAVTDTGSGGWQTINSIQTASTFTTQQCWWKVATAADFNNGSGITVTVTGAGGSGTFNQYVECDVFRLPAGFAVVGVDLTRALVGGSTVATLSWSPTVGSFYSGFTDALAFTSWSSSLESNSGGVTGTNTFTGTSAAANLATTIATNAGILLNQYVGGVQASTTAATNVFENTWTTARGPIVTGVTFVYRQTNWSYIPQSSIQSSSLTTAAVTAAPTPATGDLMVCTWGGVHGTTAFTSAAISDTGSGGWTSVAPGFQTRSTLTSQTWWKVATSADAAATITVTASGGSGTITAAIECDIFRLPAGYAVLGIDTSGGATPTATTTTSWHPSAGSTSSGFTDALSYAVATSPTSSRGLATGTNTFTGTSAASVLAPCFNTALVDFINGQYGGGVQASATAASNTWQLTWSNSVGPNVIGATFTYTQVAVAGPSSSASVSAGGIVTEFGTASPSAQASVSAVGTVSVLGTASPTAVASAAVAGVVTSLGTASPAPAASVSVAGTVVSVGAVTAAASASTSVDGVVTRFGTASPAATASVSISGVVTVLGGTAPAATASVTVAGIVTRFAIAESDAVANVSATGTVIRLGVAASTAQASVSASGLTVSLGAAGPTAVASISTAGGVTAVASASASASSSVAAGGKVTVFGACMVAAVATVSAGAIVMQFGAVAVTALASVTAAGIQSVSPIPGSAYLTAQAASLATLSAQPGSAGRLTVQAAGLATLSVQGATAGQLAVRSSATAALAVSGA